MKAIQTRVLPENWLKLVGRFDIENSNLSEGEKIIAANLKPLIEAEKTKSLINSLLRKYIEYIVFKKNNFLSYYKNLPSELIQSAFDAEVKKDRGIHLARKLHSLFIEFLTYQDLQKKGYVITSFERKDGSCDLIMSKDNKTYNFEVKFKESTDIGMSRLYDCIDGSSLLQENGFLRGKTFKIDLKVDNLNYDNMPAVLNEVDLFIDKKVNIFNGEYLHFYCTNIEAKKRTKSRDINKVAESFGEIGVRREDDVDALINKIFLGRDAHLTRLIKKSKNYTPEENFTGCLVWSIPLNLEIEKGKIKSAFQKLTLEFDLWVYVGDRGTDLYSLFIPTSE